MDSLIVFITYFLSVSRQKNVISMVVKEDQEQARTWLVNMITWHNTQEVTIPDTDCGKQAVSQ